jgi:hypothetical protein
LLELGLETDGADRSKEDNGEYLRFGDYEIASDSPQLEGGMGVVYRARQISLNRIVALKMIKGGILIRPDQVARFRAEAEAVASLDHPYIVPIYEIGEQDGRQYFTMKWFDGGSLAGRSLRPKVQSLKSAEAAAVLVAKVARAVHHAHQRGFIHRDLKPSNILLDKDGQPHVSDFGLAKRLAFDPSTPNTQLTSSGDIFGTPNYMAPEQAAGKARDVTTAADVYSLGAILYELLTGQPPFVAETAAATMHQVITEEPKRLGTTNPETPRDIETICLKCLEKEPRLRYVSAEALAEDLERWLRGEPIRARADSSWDRIYKWARRNPVVATLTVALVLTLVTGLAFSLWGMRRAEASLAEEDEMLAVYLLVIAENSKAGTDSVQIQEELAQATIRLCENLTRTHGKNSRRERMKGLAFLALSRLERGRGDNEAALTNAIVAKTVLEPLSKVEPAPVNVKIDLASANLAIASLLLTHSPISNGEFTEIEAHLLESVEQWQQISNDTSHAFTIRKQFANTCNRLADFYRRQDRPDDAVRIQRQGVSVRESLVSDFPTNWEEKANLAIDYNSLALVLAQGSAGGKDKAARLAENRTTTLTDDPYRRQEAEEVYRKAIALFDWVLAERPERDDVRRRAATSCMSFGSILGEMKRPAEGISFLQKALDHYEFLAQQFSETDRYQPDIENMRGKIAELQNRSSVK